MKLLRMIKRIISETSPADLTTKIITENTILYMKKYLYVTVGVLLPLFLSCCRGCELEPDTNLSIYIHNETEKELFIAVHGSRFNGESILESNQQFESIDALSTKEIDIRWRTYYDDAKWSAGGTIENIGDSIFVAFASSEDNIKKWIDTRDKKLVDTVYSYKRIYLPYARSFSITYRGVYN